LICSKCEIHKYTQKQCEPVGSESPMIYFIGEASGYEEKVTGKPFSGKAGQYFRSLIESLGINENNSRFNNMVKCYPQTSEEDMTFRTPTDEEIDNCIISTLKDIKGTKPKVIFPLGATALKSLVPEATGGITKNRGKVFKFGEYYIVSSFHPSYLLRQVSNDTIKNDFINDIKLAISICSDAEFIPERSKDNKSKTVKCLTYEDFDNFCKTEIDPFDDITYDVESNALEVHNVDFELVGFSLSSRKEVGCYCALTSLDFEMNIADVNKVITRLKDILETKNITVYNCQYEVPASLNYLKAKMDRVDDIFVLVKLMMGNADVYQGNGGLKAQCVMNLNYFDWSEDLDNYFKYLSDYNNNVSEMNILMSKYYSGTGLINIIQLIEHLSIKLKSEKKVKVISYGNVPLELISRYGSTDSSILFELRDFYREWMVRENEILDIDLNIGYKYWMMHHRAGIDLEMNGAHWNDKRATIVENWCEEGMLNSLKNMVISPLTNDYLKLKLREQFLQFLKNNYISEILGKDIVPKKMFKNTMDVEVKSAQAREKLSKMSLEVNATTNICKLKNGNIETLAKEFLDVNANLEDEWFTKYIREYREEEHNVAEYKSLFNPNSTNVEYRNFISGLLITTEIRYAKIYADLIKEVETPTHDITRYSGEDERLFMLIDKLRVNNETPSYQKFKLFMKYMGKDGIAFVSRPIKKTINNALKYELSSLDSGTMNEVYELYLICGNDVEDSKTWNKEFEWLFNYKMFKKFSKLLSTYVNGKVGRSNVYYVDRESYQNGDPLTKRLQKYDSNLDNTGKCMLMQQTFAINLADSGRWKSGIHNLPAGDAVKRIFSSRFPGGCIGCPDGSQMEVRTLAAECKDENLLQAFKDKLDIHRYFAHLIYDVEYDEVLDWQRGLAKNAVFGMIYGESEKAFADSYLNGDMVKAKEIFGGMYNGFPRIKEYIDKAQNQYIKFNKVTTLTQRYMILDNPMIDHNAMLRKAQNYPIQGSSEDIAGVIMYKLCEYIHINKMKSKPFCFIHDSIEIDFHPDETFQLIEKIIWLFNEFPLQEFGVPVACDVPIGMSMGQEIEVEHLVSTNNYTNNEIVLVGFLDDIEELVENWRTVYKSVELDPEFDGGKPKEVYVPFAKAFLPVKASISMHMGSNRYKVKQKYNILTK